MKTYLYKSELKIIGVNPYVDVPEDLLQSLFVASGKTKGHIPITGKVNGNPYIQTLVKFSGEWRLYINTTMLKNSPKRIGEIIELSVRFDPKPRTIEAPAQFIAALKKEKKAQMVFETLSPSRQHEIIRYLAGLKSDTALQKNIPRAINFLLGKERFVGREKP